MQPDEVSDLVIAAASGDKVAWKALAERFSAMVWAVTRSFRLPTADTADAFQTTWVRLAENLDRIDNPAAVGAWLATTARRECLRIVRTNARVVPTSDASVLEAWAVDTRTPEQIVLELEQARLDAERAKVIWKVFSETPARCRNLLRMLLSTPPPSYSEVAAAFDMRIGSIGPTRARCLRELKIRLAALGISGQVSHS